MQSLTIKDVARLAGVSVSTVSRVINDHPDVNAYTKEKVSAVIDEYQYLPNNSARSLKMIDTKNIGVMVKGITNPFFLKMLEVIDKEIAARGYSMVLQHVAAEEDEIRKALELVTEKRVCGVLFLGGSFLSKEEKIRWLNVPFVFLTYTLEECDKSLFSSVYIDDIKEAYKAVKYLITLGHKRIAFLAAEISNHSIAELRYIGYKKALTDYGIDINENLIMIADSFQIHSGYEAIQDKLKENEDFTAVFAISDMLAIGACKGILNSGRSIPDDISVMGFDGQEMSHFYNPTITTIKQPVVKMTQSSIEQLFHLINGGENNQEVFESILIEGESCCRIDT